jgi:hypothetical protein
MLVAACSDGATPAPAGDGRPPCMDTTHDEDGDGIGDLCDVCPAAPDPLQRDTAELATMIRFADGVGDACDPRPALSGDKLYKLHAFVDQAESAEWDGSGFAITGDAAHGTDTASWLHRATATGDGLYVQARMTWTDTGSFDIVLDGNGVESGLVCTISGSELRAREIGFSPITKMTEPITGEITLSAWRIIDAQMRGSLRCRVTFDGGMAELVMPTSEGIALGSYGIAQTAASTQISSLVVYTSPSPKQTGGNATDPKSP